MIPTNPAAAPTLRIVLLAAGYSTRMGRPKALARIRGCSLLERTVALLVPLATQRIIVVIPPRSTRFRAALRGRPVIFAENARRARGLSSSVRCGLLRSRYSSAILLLPLDLATLKRRDIERLIGRWKGSRRRVVARRADHRGVTPLILPRRFYAGAVGILGDRGLKDLVNELPGGEIALMDLPSAAFDVDTPHDLGRARRRPAPAAQVRAICTNR